MPLPIVFIGIAALTGLAGAGTTAKAFVDSNNANRINTQANADVDYARNRLESLREKTKVSLEELGHLKLSILSGSISGFVTTFEKIKNVDFTSSVGLDELKNFHIDQKDFQELKELSNFAIQTAEGAAAGLTGGALAAFSAYGLAHTQASASTGTAIASLSGAAASNATLAFFGGGALSAGGLGIAGGAMVLGGLVAGPALLVMGLITGAKSQENLDKALANKAQADEIVEALNAASDQCSAIRRRTYLYYDLLSYLDASFQQQVWQMEDIVSKEGTDYRSYSPQSQNIIMAATAKVGSIKALLDVPILTKDGALTPESESITERIHHLIDK